MSNGSTYSCPVSDCGSFGTGFRMLVQNSDLTPPCPPADFDDSAERYEILNENIRYTDQTVGGGGLTGTLDKIANHLRPGLRVVFGQFTMQVGPNELEPWLPRILGNANFSSDPNTHCTAPTFDNLPFDIMIERDNGVLIYRGCVINKALFRATSSQGDEQVLTMTLEIYGFEEHGYQDDIGPPMIEWPDPEPTLPTDERLYWLIGDTFFKLGVEGDPDETEYPIDAFNFMIDNKLQPLARNNLHLTCLRSSGRQFLLQMPTPLTLTTHEELYLERWDGPGRLIFDGMKNLEGETPEENWYTKFEWARLYQTRQTPRTQGRGEIPLPLLFEAYRTATEEPLCVVNSLTGPGTP